MLRQLARRAPFITMHCVGITLGLLAGFWLARQAFGPEVAGLLGAFLGAAIAVLGAFWLNDHREKSERESLRQILLDGVRRLATLASEETPDSPSGARGFARALYHRWQHLEAFSPYRELGNFSQISAMADLDACCRSLQPYLEEPAHSFTSGGDASVNLTTHTSRRMAAAVKDVGTIRSEVHRRCQEAKRALGKSAQSE